MSITKVLYLLVLIPNVSCVIKFTNVECQSFNKSRVVFNVCRLRALSRDNTALYVNATVIEPIENPNFNAQMLKRANGYKPFLFNVTIDACEYLAKRNNPATNLVYKFLKSHLIVEHYCPFVGNVRVDGLILEMSYLQNLPAPEGEYLLVVNWYTYNVHLAEIKSYFVIKEDYIKHAK